MGRIPRRNDTQEIEHSASLQTPGRAKSSLPIWSVKLVNVFKVKKLLRCSCEGHSHIPAYDYRKPPSIWASEFCSTSRCRYCHRSHQNQEHRCYSESSKRDAQVCWNTFREKHSKAIIQVRSGNESFSRHQASRYVPLKNPNPKTSKQRARNAADAMNSQTARKFCSIPPSTEC